MLVAEICRPARSLRVCARFFASPSEFAHGNCGPHRRIRSDSPVNATGPRVDRIDLARRAADEHAPAHDCRLRVGLVRIVVSECPPQFELGNVLGAQSRHRRRLKTMLRLVDSPAIPMRPVELRMKRRTSKLSDARVHDNIVGPYQTRLKVRIFRKRIVVFRKVTRQRNSFVRGQAVALLFHRAVGERVDDLGTRYLRQNRAGRRTRDLPLVTICTVRPIKLFAIARRSWFVLCAPGRKPAPGHRHGRRAHRCENSNGPPSNRIHCGTHSTTSQPPILLRAPAALYWKWPSRRRSLWRRRGGFSEQVPGGGWNI